MADGPGKEFEKRVQDAFEVVDAILKGTLLPEPSEDEIQTLGIADYDPELRYRVARDTLEQWAGKPKQQVEQIGEGVPLVIKLPDHVAQPRQLTQAPAKLPRGES